MKKFLIALVLVVIGATLMVNAQQSLGQVASGPSVPSGACGNGSLYTVTGTGALYSCNAGTWAVVSGGGGGGGSFSAITSGTNTAAAMTVGSGASLTSSGSGTVTATATPFSGVTAGTNANALVVGTGGTLGTSGSGAITATAVPFSGVSTATNTTGTLTVGTGGSLTTSGSGTIAATSVPFSGVSGTVTATKGSPAGTSGDCMQWGASGAFADSTAVCAPIAAVGGVVGYEFPIVQASASTAFPSGTITIVPYTFQTAVTMSKLTFQVTTLDASHNYDIGFYLPTSSTSATLVADIGAQALGTATYVESTFPQGSVTLQKGTYLVAMTGSAATAHYTAYTNYAMTNVTTASTSTGGALPSTITIAVGSWGVSVSQFPWMALR